MMHGISGADTDWKKPMEWVEKFHPGTQTYSIDCFNGYASWLSIEPQVECLAGAIEKFKEVHDIDNYILMCHSQGALLCRAFLMMYEHPGAFRFLSLAGPHSGVYGLPEGFDTYIPTFLRNLTNDACTAACYTNRFQESFSFCQYWRDSRSYDGYVKHSQFLAPLNNESMNPLSEEYKTNFLAIEDKVVLFGSRDDHMIMPYNSAFFGFFKDGMNVEEDSSLEGMEDQLFYKNDWFGLKTLNERGDLLMVDPDGVYHTDWLVSEDTFVTYVLPYLE